jgi:predicted TIM-barrel fold metal-dependent hydrolase
MAELYRQRAVVFLHPNELPGPAVDGLVPFAADFLLDTVRAVERLFLSGQLERRPDIRFILAHAGGFVPCAAYRPPLPKRQKSNVLTMLLAGVFSNIAQDRIM